MRRAVVFAVLALLLPVPAAAAEPPEIGPSDLRAKSRPVRARVAEVHRKALADAADWIRRNGSVRKASVAAFGDLVARYVPGGDPAGLLPDGPAPDRLDRKERDRLKKMAGTLAEAAGALKAAELGAPAGHEAFLALGLDPGNDDAAGILGYVEVEGVRKHPRERVLRERKLAPTRYGWLPEAVAARAKEGLVPEDGKWVPAAEADGRHGDWGGRRTLTFVFCEIQTALPVEQIAPWAERVDASLAWMRSLFVGVPGFAEPPWPLVVRIYRTPAEATAAGDRPPEPFAYWWKGVGIVNAAAFVPGTMPMEHVVQHELSHGLLELAFPPDPNGSVCSGWLTEAFGQWIYRASAVRPNDTLLWTFARPWLAPPIAELEAGRDLMDRLRHLTWAEGRQTDLGTAGALLADYCAVEPLRWEGFARFVGRYHGYREARGDFEALLGPSEVVSKALAGWAREHAK